MPVHPAGRMPTKGIGRRQRQHYRQVSERGRSGKPVGADDVTLPRPWHRLRPIAQAIEITANRPELATNSLHLRRPAAHMLQGKQQWQIRHAMLRRQNAAKRAADLASTYNSTTRLLGSPRNFRRQRYRGLKCARETPPKVRIQRDQPAAGVNPALAAAPARCCHRTGARP